MWGLSVSAWLWIWVIESVNLLEIFHLQIVWEVAAVNRPETTFWSRCPCKTDNRFSGSEQFGLAMLTKALKIVTRKAILKRILGSIFGFIIGKDFENNFWDNFSDNFLNIFGDFENPDGMWKFWLLHRTNFQKSNLGLPQQPPTENV